MRSFSKSDLTSGIFPLGIRTTVDVLGLPKGSSEEYVATHSLTDEMQLSRNSTFAKTNVRNYKFFGESLTSTLRVVSSSKRIIAPSNTSSRVVLNASGLELPVMHFYFYRKMSTYKSSDEKTNLEEAHDVA